MTASELGRVVGAQVLELVERHHYDRAAASAWARRHRDLSAGLPDVAALHRETRRRLAELSASHTELYTPDDPGYPHILALFEHLLGVPPQYDSIGVEVVPIGEEWFVERVFPGGPAEEAGLVRGDRLVEARGEPFHPVRPFRSRSGESVSVTIQRERGGPLRTTAVVPVHTAPPDEWRRIQQRSTARWTRRGGRPGYCVLWCCGGDEPEQLLREALSGDLRDTDGLVLDLRGGWGGCNPSLLDVLSPERDRSRRRLVLLVDRRTRSGKEVMARLVQKRGWGTVIGERTAGAVLRARPFLLEDRSVLYLAVQEFDLEGERLEGRGVEPDVRTDSETSYAGGRDRALEVALDTL
jgi:carboxyl-terminal processing protease